MANSVIPPSSSPPSGMPPVEPSDESVQNQTEAPSQSVAPRSPNSPPSRRHGNTQNNASEQARIPDPVNLERPTVTNINDPNFVPKEIEGQRDDLELDTTLELVEPEDDENDEDNARLGKGSGKKKGAVKQKRLTTESRKRKSDTKETEVKHKKAKQTVKTDFKGTIENAKEQIDDLSREINRLGKLLNLGNTESQKASIDELIDQVGELGNFDYGEVTPEILKNQIKKFLDDPLKKDYSIRAILLFMQTINQSWFSELSSMEFITREQQATSRLEGEKNLEIGKQQALMGMFTGSVTVVASAINFGSSTKSLGSARKAYTAFNKAEKKLTETIEVGKKTISDKEEMLDKLKSNLEKGGSNLPETKKAEAKTAIKKLEDEIKIEKASVTQSEKLIETARSNRDSGIRIADMQGQQMQAVAGMIDATKHFAEGAINYTIALMREELKLLEAVQTGLQFENAKLKMCMQRSFDFVNSVWGVASSIINSYYQAQKAIVSS